MRYFEKTGGGPGGALWTPGPNGGPGTTLPPPTLSHSINTPVHCPGIGRDADHWAAV